MRIPTNSLLRYVLAGVIIFTLIALGWWYFFLRGAQGAIEATDLARGAGGEAPAFRNSTGSTYENLVTSSGFGGIVASLPLLSTPSNASGTPSVLPRLWQVTKTAVAGGEFAQTNTGTGTSTVIRFVERGTGYIFEADPGTDTLRRVTNTLVPRVYDALIGENGFVVLRSLSEQGNIVTVMGSATSTDAGSEPAGLSLTPLPANITSIAMRPGASDVVYVTPNADGTATVMKKEQGKAAERITSLGLSGWQVRWFGNGIHVLQNPTSNAVSYVYKVEGGALLEALPPGRELSVLPRENSSALLYSSNFTLSARVGATTSVSVLPVRTTADKCIWAPGAALIAYCAVPEALPTFALENWRRGETYTRDSWWRVDVSSGKVELVYSPENTVDVENPQIDASASYIVFMNRIDKSLWSLRVLDK